MKTELNAETLLVFSRRKLVDVERSAGAAAVLLEGSWSDCSKGGVPASARSLDDFADRRLAWIEEEATRAAARLGPRPATEGFDADPSRTITQAWLDALALRYVLLKWLRLVAYFTEVQPLRCGQRVELTVSDHRDDDYADLLGQLCRREGAELYVRRIAAGRPARPAFAPNHPWRRLIERLAGWFPPRGPARKQHRVVLCGNPRILDPVAGEMLRRGAGVWWLYDRFAVRSWLRWRTAGVGQLVCNSSRGRSARLAAAAQTQLECRGIDLAGVATRWLDRRNVDCGARYTKLVEEIDAHFAEVRPTALLLDEDATPIARAAVAMAHRYGASSSVVQHGAPCGRFGFTPPAADRIFAWGASSTRQLVQWGVPAEQIAATGSPWHDRLHRELRPVRGRRPSDTGHGPRILLLTTVPPRDDRPDLVTHALTGQTYAEMLRVALATVAGIEGARLTVKLHPRAGHDPVVEAMLKRFPALRGRVVSGGSLAEWLTGTDCVLSCLSSAGVDATLAGVPVVQLLPRGSVDVLPHSDWGMVATARSESELRPLLDRVLAPEYVGPKQPAADVFGDFARPAAARIADAVVRDRAVPIPAPHFLSQPRPKAAGAAGSVDLAFPSVK